MNITRENCEAVLIDVIAQLLHVDALTVSILLSNPALKQNLIQALYDWGRFIGCAQHAVVDIAHDIAMHADDVVSDFVNHIFSRGTKDEKPYPRLTELIRVAHEDGPKATVKYLMRTARNRAIDLERRHTVREDRTGYVYGFNEDDEYDVIDAGEAPDDHTADLADDAIRQGALMKFFSVMGEDFVSDTVILADALGIKRKVVAQFFYAGRQTDLVSAISVRLSKCLHNNAGSHLEALMAQAKSYTLPTRLKENYDALLSFLYRKSNGEARQKLRQRLAVCGY